MSKAIGGYLGLELDTTKSSNPHAAAYAVNSGRNALQCILESLRPSMVLVPRLRCNAVLEPIKNLQIPFEYYSIDSSFRPIVEHIENGTFLLYINYFGVCDLIVKELTEQHRGKIIIDNTQAFFSYPIPDVPTFYSPRKFFGVPDGGYFYGVDYDIEALPVDMSWDRCTHLLKRIDVSAEDGYKDFLQNDNLISSLKPARMSNLTTAMLNSISFDSVRKKRSDNYAYLYSSINSSNLIKELLPQKAPALSYPLLLSGCPKLREHLIQSKVFTPKFWPEINGATELKSDSVVASDIIHLPIDQRNSTEELNSILSAIRSYFVAIRPLKKSDAMLSWKWRNDFQIWKYTGNRPDITVTEEIETEWILRAISEADSSRFAIIVGQGDMSEYVGNIQLTNIKDRRAQYHVFIGNADYWGKGVAKKATKLILEYGFSMLKLEAIWLKVSKLHKTAIHLYEKCGFNLVHSESEKVVLMEIHRNA